MRKKFFIRFMATVMVILLLFFSRTILKTSPASNHDTAAPLQPVVAETSMDTAKQTNTIFTTMWPVKMMTDISKSAARSTKVKGIATATLEIAQTAGASEAPIAAPEPSAPPAQTERKAMPQPKPVATPQPQPESAASVPTYSGNSYNALNYEEQKGVWITYLEYASILKNKTQSSFRSSIEQYFDNIASLGFNTVYVQVRAFGDAYYNSQFYPSGEQFNGTIGTSNSFDALAVMIDCAHARGLSVHAWVNPMRLMSTAQLEQIDDSYLIKQWYNNSGYNGTYIVQSNGKWYLNPAYGEVTDLIAAGITEIVANYHVDGIQIDDYFYPTTDAGFDSSAYAASGMGMSLSSWRISNVNEMVKKLYQAAHSANGTILFGISPQASVANNYNQLYADVRTWCTEGGYCDYILPQVYFGFANATTPYADTISQWSNMTAGSGVKLVIGLAAYKIGAADNYAGSGQNEWIDSSDMLKRQSEAAKALPNYGGVAMYRYDSLFNPAPAVAEQVRQEIWNLLN